MTILAQIGTSVTIREITRTFNDYGDASETNSDSTITAWIVPANCFPQDQRSASLTEKDAIGFFKAADTAKIKDGNKILYNNDWYSIQDALEILVSGTIEHVEANLIALIQS
jgi:hypothetical protein